LRSEVFVKPTRRELLRGGLALAALASKAQAALAADPASPHTLWYTTEAKRWLEALPIGNGQVGGMVFGGITKERIALTESTVWSGAPGEADVNPGGLSHLREIRQLLFEGDYVQARRLCEECLLSHPTSFGTNLPLLDLALTFSSSGETSRYTRSLDLDEGIARVEYRADGHRLTREMFASNPEDLLIVRLESDAPGGISLKAGLDEIKLPGTTACQGTDTLIFKGHAFESMHSSGKQGVEVECHVRLLPMGGQAKAGEDYLQIDHADSVTLMVTIETSYRDRIPGEVCKGVLQSASTKRYAELRQSHVADHQALFRRVHIDLGTQAAVEGTPTDQRRKAFEAGASDPGLCAVFFQFGRYLMIAGSRSNSPLPLALQGSWNDGLASSMGWTDDFHLDINTEQSYWLAEVGNLPESQTPLFALIEELRSSGRRTAKTLYNAPSWVSHVVTNPWGYTAPGGPGMGNFRYGRRVDLPSDVGALPVHRGHTVPSRASLSRLQGGG
jgi:alpha-L-fucosidase 2